MALAVARPSATYSTFAVDLATVDCSTAAVRDRAAAHDEYVVADRFAIAVRGCEVAVNEARQCEGRWQRAKGDAHLRCALQVAKDVDGVLELG